MKIYVLPYVVSNETFWTGVDFYNPNNEETSIRIQVQRYTTGVVSNVIEKKIAPKMHYTLEPSDISHNLNEPDGRATLIIVGPDNLMITPANNWSGVLIPREILIHE